MSQPTNKSELLALMREGRAHLLNVLSQIPDARMNELALYDAWTIKDFIAHLGWWEQAAAERIATHRRGEQPQPLGDFDVLNAQIADQYRQMPLDEVRTMEANGFAALERIVSEMSDDELFNTGHFATTNGRALFGWVEGNTYDHYAEHLPDVQAWMQQNGLAS